MKIKLTKNDFFKLIYESIDNLSDDASVYGGIDDYPKEETPEKQWDTMAKRNKPYRDDNFKLNYGAENGFQRNNTVKDGYYSMLAMDKNDSLNPTTLTNSTFNGSRYYDPNNPSIEDYGESPDKNFNNSGNINNTNLSEDILRKIINKSIKKVLKETVNKNPFKKANTPYGWLWVSVDLEGGIVSWMLEGEGGSPLNEGECEIEVYMDNTWQLYEETETKIPGKLRPLVYKLYRTVGMRENKE